MKQKILFVLSLLFGLMFINAGLNKFFNYMPAPKDMPADLMKVMGAAMQIEWLMPLVGLAEVVGGLLFIPGKTRALGAVVLFPVMVGIVLTNAMYAPSGFAIVAPLLAIHLWVIIENREKYAPMIK